MSEGLSLSLRCDSYANLHFWWRPGIWRFPRSIAVRLVGPSSRISSLDNSDAAAKKSPPFASKRVAVREKLVNTNTKYSLKYNSAPIYLRGDITISYVKGQALPSYFTTTHFISFALATKKSCEWRTWLLWRVARAAEPRYPQGPGNNYEAQLKTREKLCPIFIIIHLSRIEFTLEFSLRYSRHHKHAK